MKPRDWAPTLGGPLAGIVAGAVVGLLWYAGHRAGIPLTNRVGLMYSSFFLTVPGAMGAASVYFSPDDARERASSWFLRPTGSVLLAAGLTMLVKWEGGICVVMALPFFLPPAILGGALVGHFLKKRKERRGQAVLCLALLGPAIAGGAEARLPAPREEIRRVENVAVIEAPASSVWREVRSVRRIEPSEHGWYFSHAIGFPRPVAADLQGTGVGSVRRATFEGGVLFLERVTAWQEERLLRFSIRAQPVPPGTLDEHVTIGGPYFDVLEGEYLLEPLGPSRTRVRLSSRHRLSTRFNLYSGLWTDFIMRDIQGYILGIVARRAEAS